MSVKPFVKWVGGKRQILDEIISRIPEDIDKYVEPFLGGGAVMLAVLEKRPDIKVIAGDINEKLINVYHRITSDCDELVKYLSELQKDYYVLDMDGKRQMFLDIRNEFNDEKYNESVESAAWFIFLNKTCFNGLYRENLKGKFNTPFGKAEKPLICDADNLRALSALLGQDNVRIQSGEYYRYGKLCDDKTFYYLDPPYRPITNTAAFTAYSKSGFNDNDQLELKIFCDNINESGGRFLQSNSYQADGFFDDLYRDYTIETIEAKRNINSDGTKRGKVKEILIRNY